MSSTRPRPPQTGHTRIPSLSNSDTGDFPHLTFNPPEGRSPEDEPFSPPIGLGVSAGGGQSAVELVPRIQRDDVDDEKGLSGGEDDAEDNGTIREHPRRRNGHATQHSNGSPKKWKGKARAVEVDLENGVTVPMDSLEYAPVESVSPTASYPPVSDEAVEERKIAENLKRWEEQERQRRKAARDARRSRVEGDSSLSAGSLADVTRRASLLFRGGRRRTGQPDRSSMQSNASDAPLRPLSLRDGGDAELGILREPTTPSTVGSATIRTPGGPYSPNTSPLSARQSSLMGSGGKSKPNSHARPPHTNSISSAFADAKSSDEDPFSSRSSLDGKGNERPLPALPEHEQEISMQDKRWQPTLTREMTATSDAPSSSLEGDTIPPDARESRPRKWWWVDWCCGCGGEETDDEDQAGRTNPFE